MDTKQTIQIGIDRRAHSVRVRLPPFDAEFVRLSHDLFHMQRTLVRTAPSAESDTLSRYWCLAFVSVGLEQTGFWQDHQLHVMAGKYAVFLPPFSLVRWQFMPGETSFDSFFCAAERPAHMPSVPTLFKIEDVRLPSSVSDILSFFDRPRAPIPCGVCTHPSSVSRKAKEFLDQGFDDDHSLAEVAAQIRTNHTVMSRYFRRDFGLSPVEYRNLLRIRDSLRRIIFEEEAMTQIGLSVGYRSLTQFNREFKRRTNTAPRSFRF